MSKCPLLHYKVIKGNKISLCQPFCKFRDMENGKWKLAGYVHIPFFSFFYFKSTFFVAHKEPSSFQDGWEKCNRRRRWRHYALGHYRAQPSRAESRTWLRPGRPFRPSAAVCRFGCRHHRIFSAFVVYVGWKPNHLGLPRKCLMWRNVHPLYIKCREISEEGISRRRRRWQ